MNKAQTPRNSSDDNAPGFIDTVIDGSGMPPPWSIAGTGTPASAALITRRKQPYQ